MNKLPAAFGVLVILVIIAVVVNGNPFRSATVTRSDSAVTTARLPALDPDQIGSVEVSDATDHTKIARKGGAWVLPEKFDAPVMKKRADDLVMALKDLEQAEVVAHGAGAIARYEVDAAKGHRVKVADLAGKPLVDLWVGKADQAGDRNFQMSGNYVRLEGSDVVWSHQNRLQQHVMAKPAIWMDRRLFLLDSTDVKSMAEKAERVTLEFDDIQMPVPTSESQPVPPEPENPPRLRMRLEAKQREAGDPTTDAPGPTMDPKPPATDTKSTKPMEKYWAVVEPEKSEVSPGTMMVDNLIRLVLVGSYDDVIGTDPSLKQYGFDKPTVDAEIGFADGSVKRLKIGKKAPPSTDPLKKNLVTRYATIAGSDRVYEISDYAVQQMRKKPADLKPPEARAPTDFGPKPIALPESAPASRR